MLTLGHDCQAGQRSKVYHLTGVSSTSCQFDFFDFPAYSPDLCCFQQNDAFKVVMNIKDCFFKVAPGKKEHLRLKVKVKTLKYPTTKQEVKQQKEIKK